MRPLRLPALLKYKNLSAGDHVRQRMEIEVKRMGFDTQNVWRVSDINCNYKYVTDTLP